MDGFSMWHKIITIGGATVQDWAWISGAATSPPILAPNPAEDEVFIVVRGGDNAIYVSKYTTYWMSWVGMGGMTYSSPGATVCGDYLHVIVRGSDAITLWHNTIDCATGMYIGGWSWISGSTPSRPVLTS